MTPKQGKMIRISNRKNSISGPRKKKEAENPVLIVIYWFSKAITV